MDYIFTKLKVYKQITKLSYKQMSALLGISVSQFHALVTDNANKTFRQRVYTEFNNIIESLRFTIDETLWPELFLPRLPLAKWIFWAPSVQQWQTLPEVYSQPEYKNKTWTAENLETGELIKGGNYNPALYVPPFVKRMSPTVSVLVQEEDGWEKANPLPTQTMQSVIIVNGRQHLRGE